MATIKKRIEKLETEKIALINDINLILLMVKPDESEQEAIVRSGYEHNSDLSRFLIIKLVTMQNEI